MNLVYGIDMYSWAKELFPLNRSLTGEGVRSTLSFIKSHLMDLQIYEVPTGTSAFDWTIPKEWSVSDGFIANLEGKRLVDFFDSNLHVMGYSKPVDKIVTKEELQSHLHSLPNQPNAIPYLTSYYQENFGFCLSQLQLDSLGSGPFHIKIDSKLFHGSLTYGELYIPGESEKEIFFSTYICHPSMANNELSGPVVAIALAKHIMSLPSRKFSYRFLFTVETIGSIYYISRHLDKMRQNILGGWVLTCVGDDNAYTYVPTRNGNTLTDLISRRVLKDITNDFTEYSWLDRGSDERQYCAPGIDLPIGSLMRSKYDTYPEYHTSLDNLDFISPKGLEGSLNMFRDAIRILESNQYWKIETQCEPQLGKRGLYPNTSTKSTWEEVKNLMNVISYLDGKHDILETANECNLSYVEVLDLIAKLESAGLVRLMGE